MVALIQCPSFLLATAIYKFYNKLRSIHPIKKVTDLSLSKWENRLDQEAILIDSGCWSAVRLDLK
jgi:hypothetical protein